MSDWRRSGAWGEAWADGERLVARLGQWCGRGALVSVEATNRSQGARMGIHLHESEVSAGVGLQPFALDVSVDVGELLGEWRLEWLQERFPKMRDVALSFSAHPQDIDIDGPHVSWNLFTAADEWTSGTPTARSARWCATGGACDGASRRARRRRPRRPRW